MGWSVLEKKGEKRRKKEKKGEKRRKKEKKGEKNHTIGIKKN